LLGFPDNHRAAALRWSAIQFPTSGRSRHHNETNVKPCSHLAAQADLPTRIAVSDGTSGPWTWYSVLPNKNEVLLWLNSPVRAIRNAPFGPKACATETPAMLSARLPRQTQMAAKTICGSYVVEITPSGHNTCALCNWVFANPAHQKTHRILF